MCANSEGDDMAGWLDKVRTGSDRVIPEMLYYDSHYKILPYWKNVTNCACVSTRSLPLPVLTLCSRAVATGSFPRGSTTPVITKSGLIGKNETTVHAFRPGRTAPVLTLCSRAVADRVIPRCSTTIVITKSGLIGKNETIVHAFRPGRYRSRF